MILGLWRPDGRTLRWGLGCVALAAVLAVFYTFPLVLHLGSGVLRGEDTEDALQQTWVLAWVQHALLTHPSGLFDAPIFYPTGGTLAYHDNMAPLAVLGLPLLSVTANPLVIYNLEVLLSFPLCALAMYALACHLAGDPRAALLAGLIFAFCPYRVRHLEHLNLLSAEGIPLLILAVELARAQGGAWRWLAVGLCLVVCTMLSLYYAAFTLLAIGCYLVLLRFKRAPQLSRAGLRGIWALLVGLVLEAAVLLPYLRAQKSVGGERQLHEVIYFSADVRDFLHTGPQSLLYGWTDALWRIPPFDVRQYLFPGWTAVALACLGVWWAGKRTAIVERQQNRPAAWAYAAMAVVLGILALGPYLRLSGTFVRWPLPYLVVYHLVPGFAGFRDVARFDQVLMAFLAGAAACGAARLLAALGPRRAARTLVALVVLLALEYWIVQRPLLQVASGASVPPVYRWLDRQPTGAVAELPMCGLAGPHCLEESWYMYYSTYHWHPLVNGGGGFFPPGWDARTAIINTFPAPASVALLRTLSVRYVIVHPNYPGWSGVQRLIRTRGDAWPGIGTVRHLGSDVVIIMEPGQ